MEGPRNSTGLRELLRRSNIMKPVPCTLVHGIGANKVPALGHLISVGTGGVGFRLQRSVRHRPV